MIIATRGHCRLWSKGFRVCVWLPPQMPNQSSLISDTQMYVKMVYLLLTFPLAMHDVVWSSREEKSQKWVEKIYQEGNFFLTRIPGAHWNGAAVWSVFSSLLCYAAGWHVLQIVYLEPSESTMLGDIKIRATAGPVLGPPWQRPENGYVQEFLCRDWTSVWSVISVCILSCIAATV